MSRCVYFFRLKFNSTRPMSRLQVVFRGRFVCDENICYTITCLFVYPATAFGKFRRDCLHKSDISFGDVASSCGGRLSIGNLQEHALGIRLGPTSHLESDCIIPSQDHHISDSSQIFSGCSFRFACLFRS